MGVYKKGKNWYIDYYCRGRRLRKKIGPSKQLAELALKDVELKIARGEYLGIYEEKKIRFEDCAAEYLQWAEANKARSTYTREVSIFNAHLIPYFGSCYLPQITVKMIEDYQTQRAQKANVATVNREVCAIKKLFRKAVEWGYVRSSPAASIRQFRERPKPPKYLEQEEIVALLRECPTHIYALVATGLFAGLRRSEIFYLEWSDIDFERRMITVQNKEEWHTKNYESRVIPMNDTLYDALRRHPRHITSRYVFCNPKTGRIYNSVRRSLASAAERAGVGHIGLHALRHTFASQLVMAGVDLATVQKLMGHKTIQMTMRYAHLAPDHLKGAVDRIRLIDGHDMDTKAN